MNYSRGSLFQNNSTDIAISILRSRLKCYIESKVLTQFIFECAIYEASYDICFNRLSILEVPMLLYCCGITSMHVLSTYSFKYQKYSVDFDDSEGCHFVQGSN